MVAKTTVGLNLEYHKSSKSHKVTDGRVMHIESEWKTIQTPMNRHYCRFPFPVPFCSRKKHGQLVNDNRRTRILYGTFTARRVRPIKWSYYFSLVAPPATNFRFRCVITTLRRANNSKTVIDGRELFQEYKSQAGVRLSNDLTTSAERRHLLAISASGFFAQKRLWLVIEKRCMKNGETRRRKARQRLAHRMSKEQ